MVAINEEDKKPVRTDFIKAVAENGWAAFINPKLYPAIHIADLKTSRFNDDFRKKFNLPASMKAVAFSAPNASTMYIVDTPVDETFKRLEKMGIFMNDFKND